MLNLFYRNPRMMVLAISLILVSGLSSYMLLPRMEDPLLTERVAQVNTLFPGADAERVESLVTEKLEDKIREIEVIKKLRSFSRSGISSITIELRDEVIDVDPVWSRIRSKLDDAVPKLPPGALKPEFEQLDVKAYALIVGLTWDQAGPPNYNILRRLAEQLEDKFKAIPGTEEVDTFGDPDEEIQVEIDVAQLASLNLTVDDIARQIQASDARVSAGQLRGNSNLLVQVEGELDSLDRIGRTPIQFSDDGRFVPLADIATIRKAIAEPPSDLAIVGGRGSVALGVLVRPATRVDHWAATAAETVERYADSLPTGVELTTVFEQNKYVASRLSDLLFNLVLGAVAVSLVILVLMGWRSAIIVCSALPLSAFIVLTGMRFMGIPIHQMSVTGLIVALGLLIDNAIVIVDEVSVKRRSGMSAGDAVSESVRHLAIPLLGSTVTTALAFAPIAMMPGPAGEFVGSIAVSVIMAIFGSLFLALTIVPALTAMGIPVRTEQNRHWWTVGLSVPSFKNAYDASLKTVFRRPVLGIVSGVCLPVLGFAAARQLPEQFFPPADRDQFQIEVRLASQSSLAETTNMVQDIRTHVLQHPRVNAVHWFIGESAPGFYYNLVPRNRNQPSYAQALVQVDSFHETRDLIRQLQKELDREFPAARILVRQLEQGPPFDAPVEVRLFGPDMAVLRALGEDVRLLLTQIPDVIHTRADTGEDVPRLGVDIREEEARLAGLDFSTIAGQLNSSLEGAVGGAILESTEELPVRVRVARDVRGSFNDIASTPLVSPMQQNDRDFAGIPLSALADVELVPETSAIVRWNGRRMNEVQAYLTAGVLPTTVQTEFKRRLATSGFQLPDGYSLEFGGESAERDESVGNLMANVGVLAVMVLATLVLSFSSFRMAAIIGSIAFLAAGLGTGALWLFGYPFGFMAIVGTMGLIGVAINDAIVVLAAIREDDAARAGDPDAVREVVQRATRHVVATTLTTIAGFLPLLLGGGGFWPPLATAIAGGVGGATLLALYFAPSAYLLCMCGQRAR